MPTLAELLLGSKPEDLPDEELEARLLANRKARRNIMETKRTSKKKSTPASKAKASKAKADVVDSRNKDGQAELMRLLQEQLGMED